MATPHSCQLTFSFSGGKCNHGHSNPSIGRNSTSFFWHRMVVVKGSAAFTRFTYSICSQNEDGRTVYACRARKPKNAHMRNMEKDISPSKQPTNSYMQARFYLDPNGRCTGGIQGGNQQARFPSFHVQPASLGGINPPPLLHVADRCNLAPHCGYVTPIQGGIAVIRCSGFAESLGRRFQLCPHKTP